MDDSLSNPAVASMSKGLPRENADDETTDARGSRPA
jgi:hypothetical protein